MRARVHWPHALLEVLAALPAQDKELIFEKTRYLELFPRMYPVRVRGRFRRHRWFLAGDWLVYYRVVGEDVFIRGLWPARMP